VNVEYSTLYGSLRNALYALVTCSSISAKLLVAQELLEPQYAPSAVYLWLSENETRVAVSRAGLVPGRS